MAEDKQISADLVGIEKNNNETISLPEQNDFLKEDLMLSNLELDQEGKILGINDQSAKIIASEWAGKTGAIDTKTIYGATIVVYNANIDIPEGCPDLRNWNRSGEYDPETKTCFVDISSTYDYVNDRYRPEWVQRCVRHEPRHHLVNIHDEEYGTKHQVNGRRNIDWDDLNENHPEGAKQLAYLDELHSQYLDVIEGDIEGKKVFREINSKIYSIAGEGSHLEIAAIDPKSLDAASELFYCLQATILIKRMVEIQPDIMDDNTSLFYKVGAVLGIHRSVIAARNETNNLLDVELSKTELKNKFQSFIANYNASEFDNTPLITPELLKVLNIGESTS